MTKQAIHLVTIAGPPSAGKTSLIVKSLISHPDYSSQCGVVKFDCLNSLDEAIYRKHQIPVLSGVAGNLCPDHYFITNIENCVEWAQDLQLKTLIIESAGLCNRCSPHVKKGFAVCVLDCLAGIDTPHKIGPMLKRADQVILTKGDMISQAEREVYRYRVQKANPRASVLFVNGISGQGCDRLLQTWTQTEPLLELQGSSLRFTMPTAVCSYCLGETRIGKERQIGLVKTMEVRHEH